jgi:hypothetical protein
MASSTPPSKDRANIENLRQVIHLLNLALEDCQRLLEIERQAMKASGQDNEPLPNG